MSERLVKPVQSRRGVGWSKIEKAEGGAFGVEGSVYIKSQQDYMTRSVWRLYRKTPTLFNEYKTLLYCLEQGIPVPEPVSFEGDGRFARLVIRAVEPASELDDFLARADAEQSRQVIIRLALLLRRLHRLWWVHGALGNEHILVRPDGEVVIIDWEKARRNPFKRAREMRRFWRRTTCLDAAQRALFESVYRSGN